MPLKQLPGLTLSHSAMSILETAEAEGRLHLAGSVEELVALATPDASLGLGEVAPNGFYTVGYDVPGRGFVPEAEVCQVKNGVAANYLEAYMRRRDPDCMVVGDHRATDKPTFEGRFGEPFDKLRSETLDWLKSQPIACFFFRTGLPDEPLDAVAIAPANAGFFALGLAMLQGIVPLDEIRLDGPDYHHGAVVYVAPPFRHTHFDGKQVVVHNRRLEEEIGLHELFSYNLYPGPSAKKGVYGMLLTLGEQHEQPWTTAHCSTVEVMTPYENATVIMHEGASGGGKSEMLEQMHREADGTLLLGTNTVTGDARKLVLPRGCDLRPVTDDMALCHPSLQKTEQRKLSLIDAENAWFLRVNHIDRYGTDPYNERLTVDPPGPLLFLNIDAHPGATALIWEHTMDAPGKPCPNPRVVVPRKYVPDVINGPVTVDIRSFGVRCPPCTRENPTYGIMGLFHVLPPSLAWLWRLVAPRGHGNPSIVDQGGMQSEGVGSFWPFATGRKVDQANILLDQIMQTDQTQFVLIPNQNLGCWKVGFAPQWVAREYLARRGSAKFKPGDLKSARCSLLGYHKETLQVEGHIIGKWFMDVSQQPEVGEEAYDEGARILTEFFHQQLREFTVPDLQPLGQRIIDACLGGATPDDYAKLGT
ncbi:hypothetical protein Pla108_13080 [Botrimarina colliarenosi]|uniref:DUF4914 domain-containing protein n=1 Tax=Botrimarina colliarenosi TaxID=2528001 RepID=A0A5C6AM58_9BACT|nr:DUF4914 family protein [Botrimarina colliarenosi]TWU00359.1 hypothetical protein Pla108_13080 [Botrimarina colliarenosi]